MPDRLFFLIAAAIAGLMVFIALEPYANRAPRGPLSGGGRNAEDITVRGPELNRFLAGEFGTIQIETPEGGDAIVRIVRLPGEAFEDPRSGPHLELAEDLEFVFEVRPVEITIEARSTGDLPAETFEANYMARPGYESGWKSFPLTAEFATYSFSYTPPARGANLGYDYLGLRPGLGAARETMEVRSIRFRTLGPKDFSLTQDTMP
jgi:hypothetical protein